LLASPSFAAWAEGPDIDVDRLLRAQDGNRPACAIVALSHLSDEERQFVVSLLLGKLVTWMRGQPGTDRLRVLVYFDEVMGFVPPTAMPPAKKPILTLFKTARAFGVGLVLATQNPVDVDYRGLSNAGTWMIGRLQTEQDRARLLDGLSSSAAGSGDIEDVSDMIAGLGKRQFMMREPGRDAPSLFTTRWAMSYLRGPLTREQIATLMQGRYHPSAPAEDATPSALAQDATPTAPTGPSAPTAVTACTASTGDAPETVPVPPPGPDDVPVRWLAPDAPWAAQVGAVANGTRLAPSLVTRVSLLYDDDKLDLRETEEWEAVLFPLAASVDPAACIVVDHDDRDLRSEAPPSATYVLTDAPIDKKTFFTGAERALVDHLYRTRTMQVMRNPELKLVARVGETPEQFTARCSEAAAEGADRDQVALQTRYEAASPKRGRPSGRRGTGSPRPAPRRTRAASRTWSQGRAACSTPSWAGDAAPAGWRVT
jgi:hypothetical protein